MATSNAAVRSLLNIDANAKTVKGQKRGYLTAVLYLTPSDVSGVQTCPTSEVAGCAAGCLNTAGRGGMAPNRATFTAPNGETLPDNTVQRARLARTRLFNTDRSRFLGQLVAEINAARRKARKRRKTLAVRLNGTSDIRWENIPVTVDGVDYPHIFAAFPTLQFYDYTKIPNRRVADIPNYHLTFSYSDRLEYAPIVVKALKHYGARVNFAAVFRGDVPRYFLGRRVINGDESDLRFLDASNVTVALTAKGRAKKDTSGFVVKLAA